MESSLHFAHPSQTSKCMEWDTGFLGDFSQSPHGKQYETFIREFWNAYLCYRSTQDTFDQEEEVPSFSMVYSIEKGWCARSGNLVETYQDPNNHSEILAMKDAKEVLQTRYLTDCTLFTLLEPCFHCASAILKYRLQRVIYFLPALRGQGMTSFSFEMLYQAYHLPELVYIPIPIKAQEWKKFFQKIREKSKMV